MKESTQIEVTLTDLIRCGYPRSAAKAALAKVPPARKAGRVLYYEMTTAIRTLNEAPTDPKTRRDTAEAELAEEKVRRIRGQSVDAIKVRDAWVDILVRIIQSIKSSHILSKKDKFRVVQQIREDIKRGASDIAQCAFDECDAKRNSNR